MACTRISQLRSLGFGVQDLGFRVEGVLGSRAV